MNRGRLLAVAAGAVVLTGAIVTLRSGVQPPARSVVAPDGERITAYHDPALVDPPRRPSERPQQPGRLHTDARRGGAVVSWPPAPYGFEVRWGPAGEPPGQVRYVATPSTGLYGLRPGRYHVEVRSVDEVGQRSEPSSADVEVGDRPPPWQQGLGFVDDFTAGADLRADRWQLSDLSRQCLRREGDPGPILLDGRCNTVLRPVSPLVLSDPQAGGVRGRVVVLADAPGQPPPPAPSNREPPPEPPPPDEDYFLSNELIVAVTTASAPYAEPDVQLRIGSTGAFLDFDGFRPGRPSTAQRLSTPHALSPGALHRWELVFTADQVQVFLDGEQIGSADHRPSWRQADVVLYPSLAQDDGRTAAARVALVGLTGPEPDGRAVEIVQVTRGGEQPGAEQRFPIPALPDVQSATLVGLLISTVATDPTRPPPPPSEVRAELGGQPLRLARQPNVDPAEPSFWFTADVPVAALASSTALTLRSVDGSEFAAVAVELKLVHRPGTVVDVQQPRVERVGQPATARPQVVVRHGQEIVGSGQPAPRARLDVEVRLDVSSAQSAAGELAGIVALRVELEGRRILDFPTAVGGPAVTGSYRFTLDTTDLPPGSYQALTVSLIPDRPAVPNGVDRFTVRMAP